MIVDLNRARNRRGATQKIKNNTTKILQRDSHHNMFQYLPTGKNDLEGFE